MDEANNKSNKVCQMPEGTQFILPKYGIDSLLRVLACTFNHLKKPSPAPPGTEKMSPQSRDAWPHQPFTLPGQGTKPLQT